MVGKRVTSFDVARAAGVSRSVVSAVLNGTPGIGVSSDTRQAVLDAIRDLNYHVDAQARGMKTGRSQSVAAFGDTCNPLFLQVLEGMQRACSNYGYHILINGHGTEGKDRQALIDLYLQRKIDGIVTLDPIGYADVNWAESIQKHKIPYVSIEGFAEWDGIVSVLTNYRLSVLDALQYMYGRVAARSVYLEVHNGQKLNNWAEKSRREAYESWCRDHRYNPEIHFIDLADKEGIRSLFRDKRDRGTIPPILTNWSYGAIAVYRAAHEMGLRIGHDLYIMSADNTLRVNPLMVPSLSHMEIQYASMGEKAIDILLNRQETDSEKHWIRASLVPGESI